MPSLARAGTAELSQFKDKVSYPHWPFNTCWKTSTRSVPYGLLFTLETYTSVAYRHEAIQLHMLTYKGTERRACTTKKKQSIKIHENNVRKTNAT